MKKTRLLAKTNLYTLTVTLFLFSIGAFVIYKTIVYRFDSEVMAHLASSKRNIIKDLASGVPAGNIFAKNDTRNYIHEIKGQKVFTDRYSIETEREGYNEEEEEEEEEIDYKTLVFQTTVHGKSYEVKISSSLSEGREIRDYVTGVVVGFLAISTLILLILNQFISRRIWKPFNSTIKSLSTWSIQQPLLLRDTDIHEFFILNASLLNLTQKIELDYLNLKEFTENVSHETQTPLTILNNKLELLLQENNYTTAQLNLLNESYAAVQRLHKLNKTLILLSRIENSQFIEKKPVELSTFINEKIKEFEEFTDAKHIRVEKKLLQNIVVDVNPVLINVLFDNLFLNAIKYNTDQQGTIKLHLDSQSMTIENSSFLAGMSPKFLFERIAKNSTSGSLGIGLSLIKKITDFYGWSISYSYAHQMHSFSIHFKK